MDLKDRLPSLSSLPILLVYKLFGALCEEILLSYLCFIACVHNGMELNDLLCSL